MLFEYPAKHSLCLQPVCSMSFTGGIRSTFTNRLKNNPVIFVGFDGQGPDEQRRCARATHLVAHHGDNRFDPFVAAQPNELLMKQLVGLGPGFKVFGFDGLVHLCN